MNGAILGFQRCWRWPKWAPDSNNWRMENSGKAMSSVSFTGWPDAGITSWEAPDGDGRTPAESHPRVRDGGAYRGLGPKVQAGLAGDGTDRLRCGQGGDFGGLWAFPGRVHGPVKHPGAS